MRILDSIVCRWRSLRHRDQRNAELNAELEFHLQAMIQQNLAQGKSGPEARRMAMATFGSLADTTERSYEARGVTWLDDFFEDLRYGTRSLNKQRSFTCITVLILAIGIGACTAIFSLIDAVVLHSLPLGNPQALVYLFTPSRQLLRLNVPAEVFTPTFADFVDLKRQSRSFAAMTLFEQTTFNLAADDHVQQVGAARVDADFFRTLQTQPERGRPFDVNDERPGSGQVVILSQALWRAMFGGKDDVLGRNILLDGTSYRIVGVMPASFEYPHATDIAAGFGNVEKTEIWVPSAFTSQQLACREGCGGFAVGRLKTGITLVEAQTEVSGIMSHLDLLHNPQMNDLEGSLRPLLDMSAGSSRRLLWLLMGAVGLVMLIACSNAANLLLARAAGRLHELGVRATLGARNGRLFRQMLTESLLLGLIAGCVGAVLAWIFLHALLWLKPEDIPRLQEARLNPAVLSFLLALTLLTSLLFGIFPSYAITRSNLIGAMKRGGARGVVGNLKGMRRGLVATQVALAVMLLACAGLLLRSYARVLDVPTGFSSSTLTAGLQMGSQLTGAPVNPKYDNAQKRQTFLRELLDKLKQSPGFEAVGLIDFRPLSRSENITGFEIRGVSGPPQQSAEFRRVTPGYFSAMRIPLLRGRDLQNTGAPSVVINQAFASQYFVGGDAIGHYLRVSKETPWLEVVGVIADLRNMDLETAAVPQLYMHIAQADTDDAPINGVSLAVRSSLPPNATATEIEAAVQSLDADLPIANVRTMKEVVAEATARRRFQTAILAVFSGMALLLAVVGLYGLLAYGVQQRTDELGLRIAMGCTRIGVTKLVLQEGLVSMGAGLLIGLAASLGISRLLSEFLYGLPAADPATYVVTILLMLFAALAACLLPSVRAATIDPMEALRRE